MNHPWPAGPPGNHGSRACLRSRVAGADISPTGPDRGDAGLGLAPTLEAATRGRFGPPSCHCARHFHGGGRRAVDLPAGMDRIVGMIAARGDIQRDSPLLIQ